MRLTDQDRQLTHKLRKGDIMTVYHPESGLAPVVECKEKYKPRAELRINATLGSSAFTSLEDEDRRPWHPFTELLDFEFAEVALSAHLTRAQITKLLKIIQKIKVEKAPFTLETYDQLQKTWETASVLQTSVGFSQLYQQVD